MIRKILLFSIFAFIAVWFTGSHIIKWRVQDFLNDLQTDNVKISYNNIGIAGFPFSWQVKVSNPKITVTDRSNSREVSFDYHKYIFDFRLKNLEIDLGKVVTYTGTGDSNESAVYSFKSENEMLMYGEFAESLYALRKQDVLRDKIKTIEIKNNLITAEFNGVQQFDVSGGNLVLYKTNENNIDNLGIKLSGEYKAIDGALKIKTANLILDLNYIINSQNDSNFDFDHMLEVKNSILMLDSGSVKLAGVVKLKSGTMPFGEIAVSMTNYKNITESLFSDDFIISKSYINKLISGASASSDNQSDNPDTVNFKVEFSNQGVSVK